MGQNFLQCAVRPARLKGFAPDLFHDPITEKAFRPRSQLTQDGLHSDTHILACGLADLHIDVQTAIPPAAVQFIHQCQQCRRLARLPGRVQDEVLISSRIRASTSSVSKRSNGGMQ